MKEQDYMKLMGSIRGEYLEEAVSWDGSERRRIRQIRRMTVSFGAVAAALAVVVGMIAYKANKDKIDIANSNTESSMIEDLEGKKNLYGGNGVLRQITDRYNTICYDDSYVYEGDAKWSVQSGGKVTRMSEDEIPQLFKDGTNLFTLHDNKIFETDSFGNEKACIDFAEFKSDTEYDPNRLEAVQKLSDRLIALFFDIPKLSDSQTVVIADLQKKEMNEGPVVQGSMLFPDTESSFYVFGLTSQELMHCDWNTGESDVLWLAAEVFNDPAYTLELRNAAMQNGKLYLTGRYYKSGEETAESMSDQYMILDVATNKLTTHQFSTNERIYAGTAFLRSVIADGKYSIYRSTLDLENEQLVYEVPADQFLDTAKYGMPEQPSFLSAYESDDMIILHLPLSSDGIPRPSRHGEDGVKIDLRTGKVLYYGDNYSLDTPEESGQNITTTIVNGTGAAGTTLSGTTVSSTGTNGTATSAAQTTAAKFTVAADHNIFGGSGRLTALGGNMWQDDQWVYELAQSGSRYSVGTDGSLTRVGTICTKNGCKHDNETCPLFHYNFEGNRSNPNSTAYDGQNVSLVCGDVRRNELFVQRGTKLYTVDSNTGEETLWIDVKPFDGMNIGDKDLFITDMTGLRGAHDTDIGKYLLTCSVSLEVPGVDPDATYRILVDRNSNTQKLVGKVGQENYDGDMLCWGSMTQDTASDGSVYMLQNDTTLVRFDTGLNRVGSYRLPVAEDAKPCTNAYCVVNQVMWYLNAKNQWCSFDLNTGAVTVVKEQTDIAFHEQGSPECFYFENLGMFFARNGAKLMMFRYDMANCEDTGVEFYSLLHQQNLNYIDGTFFGLDSDNGFKVFSFNAPAWMPGPF